MMNVRTKSALLLFVTLVVGGLIGAFATSTVLNHRLDQLRSMRERRGFTDVLEEVIQPRDAAQQAEIQAVLERSQARYMQARRQFGEQLSASRDSLKVELAPLLTPEQQERLTAWLARDHRPRAERGRPRSERNGSHR